MGSVIVFDEDDAGGSPAEGFQADRPGAGTPAICMEMSLFVNDLHARDAVHRTAFGQQNQRTVVATSFENALSVPSASTAVTAMKYLPGDSSSR